MFLSDGALLTDLYQLAMLDAYWDNGLTAPATFELFVRRLPERRAFLVAAGLEQALDYLEALRFTDQELVWLRASGLFRSAFIERLAALRFTGDVDAMPEGTVFFVDEPIVRVTAQLPEAQLVETRLLNILHAQTLFASKAARSVLAAPGKRLIEFGLRRTHGAEAGLFAARAAWLVGFAGTSNVLAGARWGIPIFGTMAHSYVLAHDREEDAFLSFARSRPEGLVLLIDTYDTEAAARMVVRLARERSELAARLTAVRLDSGDLAAHARAVREILDAGGLRQVGIFASGNLDEEKIAALEAAAAPIDGYGPGTRVSTSADAPYLDCAYKLVEYDGRPRFKLSEGKATRPGAKQVFRTLDDDGRMERDEIVLAGERRPGANALLEPVMRAGKRLARTPLADARAHAAAQLAALPAQARRLRDAGTFPVAVAASLDRLMHDSKAGKEDEPCPE